MVKVSKFLGYSIFFILALMYFTPKVALYYFLETQLKPYGVIITDENVVDNGFTLSVKDSVVTFKAIESATIKDINIALFALYNKVEVEDITLASTAATFAPTDVKNIDISYSIFNPLYVVAASSGGFGEADVQVSLLDRKLILKLKPSKIMTKKYRSTLRNLKKSKDGGYEYAKKLSNSALLKIISVLLILLVVAKVISLVILYILPSDGVELSIEESYQPKYQRVDFKNMLSFAKEVKQDKKEVVKSGVSMTNMILKGLYGTRSSGFIIVALKSKPKDTTIVEVGDVYSGYTLVEIEKSAAIFNKNSTRYTLNLESAKIDTKYKKVKSKSKAKDEPISQKVVSKTDIEHYAKNPKQIWKEISIIELKEGNEIKGFKVTRIDPNSKMATLGLRKNDIIIKANNVVLKSYRDALNIYSKIKDIDVMQIVVIRDGVEKEIVYEIN